MVKMTLDKLYRHLDYTQDLNVQVLRMAVGIASKSSDTKMATMAVKWAEKRLRMLGAVVEMVALRGSGDSSDHPAPLLLATLGDSPNKKRLLVYGNVTVSNRCEEFSLTVENGILSGNGVTDGKGPLAVWFRTLEAFQQLKMDIPVNLKFAISGCDLAKTGAVEDVLFSRRQRFLKNIDFVCITGGAWLTDKRPCLVYGMRGVCHFAMQVKSTAFNVHSGYYGGLVNEAMEDVLFLMDSMTDEEGKIVVPCVMQDVAPISLEEEAIYKSVYFEPEKLREEIGVSSLLHSEDKVSLLMHNWRYPSLSFHGIDRAGNDEDVNPSIQSEVVAKFSIRLVQHQTPARVTKAVTRYLETVHASRQSHNTLNVCLMESFLPWAENPSSPHYVAAQRAATEVYHQPADMIRVGASVSMASALARIVKRSIVVLPIGPHQTKDSIKLELYQSAHKMVAAYLVQLAALSEI